MAWEALHSWFTRTLKAAFEVPDPAEGCADAVAMVEAVMGYWCGVKYVLRKSKFARYMDQASNVKLSLRSKWAVIFLTVPSINREGPAASGSTRLR
jgi:hypothetical protein